MRIVSRIVNLLVMHWVFIRPEDSSNVSMCGLYVLGHAFLVSYEVSFGINAKDSVWTIENRHSCNAAHLLQ